MKNKLVMCVLALGIVFSSCNKETFEGEYDLNNDGKSQMVFSRNSSKGNILYSPKGPFEIDTIFNFGKKPSSWGFNYENDDSYLDLSFYQTKGEDFEKYIVYNKNGVLLHGEVKKVKN